eukprot:6393422-Pyramimonas_sp.AAC.1
MTSVVKHRPPRRGFRQGHAHVIRRGRLGHRRGRGRELQGGRGPAGPGPHVHEAGQAERVRRARSQRRNLELQGVGPHEYPGTEGLLKARGVVVEDLDRRAVRARDARVRNERVDESVQVQVAVVRREARDDQRGRAGKRIQARRRPGAADDLDPVGDVGDDHAELVVQEVVQTVQREHEILRSSLLLDIGALLEKQQSRMFCRDYLEAKGVRLARRVRLEQKGLDRESPDHRVLVQESADRWSRRVSDARVVRSGRLRRGHADRLHEPDLRGDEPRLEVRELGQRESVVASGSESRNVEGPVADPLERAGVVEMDVVRVDRVCDPTNLESRAVQARDARVRNERVGELTQVHRDALWGRAGDHQVTGRRERKRRRTGFSRRRERQRVVVRLVAHLEVEVVRRVEVHERAAQVQREVVSVGVRLHVGHRDHRSLPHERDAQLVRLARRLRGEGESRKNHAFQIGVRVQQLPSRGFREDRRDPVGLRSLGRRRGGRREPQARVKSLAVDMPKL